MIDDDADLCELAEAHSKRLKVDVEIVRTGARAVALLNDQNEKFDLVVLDLNMPGIDGLAIFNEIRRLKMLGIHEDLKVVIMSGDPSCANQISRFGIAPFVAKPTCFSCEFWRDLLAAFNILGPDQRC